MCQLAEQGCQKLAQKQGLVESLQVIRGLVSVGMVFVRSSVNLEGLCSMRWVRLRLSLFISI